MKINFTALFDAQAFRAGIRRPGRLGSHVVAVLRRVRRDRRAEALLRTRDIPPPLQENA